MLAFDGDGTLWSGDVGEDFFHYAVERRLLRAEALEPLQLMAESFSLPRREEPNAQAALMFEAFEAGQLPELETCEFMAWCFAGWQPAQLTPHVRDALSASQLEERYFEPTVELARWARQRGHKTVVVSASPHMVVTEAVRPLGFAFEDVAAGMPICDETGPEPRLQPELAYPLPYAGSKLLALRTIAADLPVLAAFGDNVFDLEMLAAAIVPVAVRPKPRLSDRLSELAECFLLA